MTLNLTRTTTTKDALIGCLSVDDVSECATLENRDLAIPLGTYEVGIYDSPHAGHPVPILKNVKGRDFVEIHSGNIASDSKGCILVGQQYTNDTISGSHLAFAHLFPQIQSAIDSGESVEITIS